MRCDSHAAFGDDAHLGAHHAFAAEYDENKRVAVSGTVTKFQWTNPHAWLYVDGKDESGKVTIWSFEMGSPNGLVHRGWRRAELKSKRTTNPGISYELLTSAPA